MEKIGKQLKDKRLELGMSIDDVCKKTRLTKKHVKALEAGDVEFFHDDLAYLRFFVKSYCDAVEIDFEDVKDELRESVNDYTETLSMSLQQNHEESEKNIVHSDKLTHVSKVDERINKVRPSRKGMRKHDLKKVDFSFVSLLAIGAVVVIVLICALVIFLRTTNNETTTKEKDQPIAQTQEKNGENEYPTSNEKVTPKKNSQKVAITKTDVKQYTIENVSEGEELKFEVTFNGSSSGFSIGVDDEFDEESAKVYEYLQTATTKVKVKKNSKIQMYVGWMNAITLKINGKNVKIDDSIAYSNTSQTLEFNVVGVE